jgi:hypothetical protein
MTIELRADLRLNTSRELVPKFCRVAMAAADARKQVLVPWLSQ